MFRLYWVWPVMSSSPIHRLRTHHLPSLYPVPRTMVKSGQEEAPKRLSRPFFCSVLASCGFLMVNRR